MRCRPSSLWLLVVLGWAASCRKDGEMQPAAADPAPVVAADAAEPARTAPTPVGQVVEEDESAPSGPAVEVRVADDPAQPLAWYRGFTTDRGQQGAVLYSRKASSRVPLPILDGGVALRGLDKPTAARKGPPRLVGDRPMLLSIGAQWCKPCSEELGDVVDLARKVRGDAPDDAPGLLFALQGVPDEWPLAEVRNEFVAKHKAAKKLRQAIEIPAWVEFRADIESNWGQAVGKLGLLGGDSVSLPINLLVDRCGHVQAAASGALNEDKKQAFLRQAAKLGDVTCMAAPVLAPVAPRPAPGPVKPRVDPKPGEAKTEPPVGIEPSGSKDEPGLKVPPAGEKPHGERPAPADGAKADSATADKAAPPTAAKPADKPKDDKPAEKTVAPPAADKPKDDKPKDDKPADKKAESPAAKEAAK